MKNKISVGEIVKYLFYLQRELSTDEVSERVLKEGQWYHQKLGFNQPEIFQRYFKYNENGNHEWWLVRGCPDRIEIEEGVLYVDELKTVRNNRKSRMLEIGSTQANLYAWLVGSELYRVFLYDVLAESMEEYVFKFDGEKAERDIRRGIETKKMFKEMSKKFRKRATELREDAYPTSVETRIKGV